MTTTLDTEPIYHFDNPPVAEVVCGIQFAPLTGFMVSHFGQLWEQFKSAGYETCQDASPLLPIVEIFDSNVPEATPEIRGMLLPRAWFIHRDGTGIVQVQRDRFLHNWKKASPEADYPHYHEVKRYFRDRYDTFVRFLADNQLGDIKPSQYEMTYVNHIPRGEGWKDFADIGKVFPDFVWKTDRHLFLPAPSWSNLSLSFDLPENVARLHVNIRNGVRRNDKESVLLFELTVRGLPSDTSSASMWRWFDLAREWIVRAFADLTDEDFQRSRWRKAE